MNRVATLAGEWERAKAGTKDYLEAVAADQLGFRPAQECRSFAEQFLHLASTQYAFAASATGRANPLELSKADPEKDEKLKGDPEAFREFVLDSYDFMINGVRALDPTALDEEVQFGLTGITPPSQRLF